MQYQVKVIPNAKQEKLVEENGMIKVWLTAHPEAGKANLALIKLLSKYFKVSKSSVKILRGEKSKEKIVEIYD
jgi:uncharacterized protein (TIGR00251 family)